MMAVSMIGLHLDLAAELAVVVPATWAVYVW
jgi:hypothetical protein